MPARGRDTAQFGLNAQGSQINAVQNVRFKGRKSINWKKMILANIQPPEIKVKNQDFYDKMDNRDTFQTTYDAGKYGVDIPDYKYGLNEFWKEKKNFGAPMMNFSAVSN